VSLTAGRQTRQLSATGQVLLNVGIVEQVGELVTGFNACDRVVIPTGHSDWRRPRAQRGEAKYYQTNNPYYTGDPTVGGAFSEYDRTRDVDMNLSHIPDGVTDVQAVLVPDMVATAFTGVERMEI
jgi:threonine dehydrogenase-like Zn-dependent dehydrogenase